jgi:hypothetical protein
MLFDYKAESRPRSYTWVTFWKFFNHWLAKHHALVVISIAERYMNKDVLLEQFKGISLSWSSQLALGIVSIFFKKIVREIKGLFEAKRFENKTTLS